LLFILILFVIIGYLGGYRREQKQSVIALRWMMWREETEGLRIQHKLTGGEVTVPGTKYRVDGYIDRSATGQRPLALEFNGFDFYLFSTLFTVFHFQM
jgi:hypothetical protein